MAYLGLRPQRQLIATSTQKLSGNGVDFEYFLNRAVSKAADLTVYVDGTVQIPEVDYTASSTRILFTTEPASGTDNIVINYTAGALTTVALGANSFPQGSAVSPSIRYVDATSTGLWFPTVNSIGLSVSGNTRVTVADVQTASSTSAASLSVLGGVGLTQNLIVGGNTRILDTTVSTNSTSGALVVSGGTGIAGELNVGGSLNVAGDFTVAGQFTTTGADSLAINDPFIFLANANPGDALDTGFVSSYTVDEVVRYAGLFRDITDGKYRLFDNLTVQPTTVVDTSAPSFRLADLVVGNITAQNISGSENITTVGNLANLSVQGTISSYDIVYVYNPTSSTSTTTGALQVKGGAGIVGNVNAGNVNATNLTGTILTASQTNITAVGTITTGTWSATTIATNKGGTGLTSFTSGGALYATSTSALTTGTLPVASGGTGTTTSTGSGSVVLSTSPTFTTQITTPAIVKSGSNGTGDIGQTDNRFGTIYGKATSAQYADVAERYLADADYAPGTVLHFGGDYEVSQCNVDHCTRVAGVVSTNPAYIMNDSLQGEHVVDVALLGRVPCQVQGLVSRGDMMVSAGNGRARAEANPKLGAVIGKALQDFNGEHGVIEVVVGRI